MKPSDLQGWFQAGGHLFIFLMTGSCSLYFVSEQMWLPFAVLLFIHGTSASFFKGIAAHELDHGTVFKTKKLNQLFLQIYSLMSWHLEHHMFAGVPCYNLKKLHQLVAYDMPKTRTLLGAWREMLEIKRQQDIDPSYEFDTPMPEPIEKTTEEIKSLTDSIGDLAPESLKYILTRP
jgi:fatty acid desaturase